MVQGIKQNVVDAVAAVPSALHSAAKVICTDLKVAE
jgi:hypothetical protein